MVKKSFFILIIFAAIIFFSLTACEFEELGISTQEKEPADSEIIKTISEELTGEELFLELKSKQIDKNPLRDVNIRKAIMHAIDRESIVEDLLGEYGEVSNSLFLEDSPFYFDSWSVYDYDVEKAREYLEKAGYGKQNPLYLTIGTTNDSVSKMRAEELIKEDLEEIGINIWFFNKEPKEWYVDYLKNGNFELGIWALYTVDGTNLKNYFSSSKIPPKESENNLNCDNFYWYSNQEVDELLESLNGDISNEIKVEILQQIQQGLAENAFILPLYRRIFSVAYYDKVIDLNLDKRDGNFLKSASIWDMQDNHDDEEVPEKQVNVGYQHEPYTMNPLSKDTSHRDYILSMLSEGLWKIDEYGKYVPNLLDEEIIIKENDVKALLRARVRLKEGLYWEDGNEINSEDIKDTMDFILSGNIQGIPDRDYSIIKEIVVLDDYDFEIVFNEYQEGWQNLFDFIFPSDIILEENLSTFLEDDFFSYGPFKLSEWVKSDHMVLEPNYYYKGDKPKIDSVQLIFNSDINYLIGLFREGEIEILNIPADLELIQDIEAGDSTSVLIEQGNLWEHLALSLKPVE